MIIGLIRRKKLTLTSLLNGVQPGKLFWPKSPSVMWFVRIAIENEPGKGSERNNKINQFEVSPYQTGKMKNRQVGLS
jgi:hypothetical protein